MAKCPKCGKKMSKKKTTCKCCGYTVNPDVSPVNYYMYDAKSPNVVYPMKVSKHHAQENPFGANKLVRKNRCPKCARRLSENKQFCKCGYERPGFINQKKARWFGLVLAILSALVIALVPFTTITGLEGWSVEMNTAFLVFQNGNLLSILNAEGLWFEALPVFDFWGETGYLYNVAVYVFILCGVLAALQAFFACFTRTKAAKRVRKSLFTLGLGALLYSLAVIIASMKFAIPAETEATLLNLGTMVVDLVSIAIAAVALLASFILKRVAKKQAKAMLEF